LTGLWRTRSETWIENPVAERVLYGRASGGGGGGSRGMPQISRP
jgi:hypothetical protein